MYNNEIIITKQEPADSKYRDVVLIISDMGVSEWLSFTAFLEQRTARSI